MSAFDLCKIYCSNLLDLFEKPVTSPTLLSPGSVQSDHSLPAAVTEAVSSPAKREPAVNNQGIVKQSPATTPTVTHNDSEIERSLDLSDVGEHLPSGFTPGDQSSTRSSVVETQNCPVFPQPVSYSTTGSFDFTYTRVIVVPRGFPSWQEVFDLVSMVLTPLGRLGKVFHVTVDGELDSHSDYSLHLHYQNTSSASSYILKVTEARSFIKAGDFHGIRNGLVSFLQLAMDKPMQCAVVYDRPLLSQRSVLLDVESYIQWKLGVLYEFTLLLSLMKYNQILLPLSVDVADRGLQCCRNTCKLHEKLIEIVVLAERFSFDVIPYLEVSSPEISAEEFADELQVMCGLLRCFNNKRVVALGFDMTSMILQIPDNFQRALFSLQMAPDTHLLLFPGSVSCVTLAAQLPNVTVVVSREELAVEATRLGLSLATRGNYYKPTLIGSFDELHLRSHFGEQAAAVSIGHVTVLSNATEAVSLLLPALPELISHSRAAWTGGGGRPRLSGGISLTPVVTLDRLLFNQVPGFGRGLAHLQAIERALLAGGEDEAASALLSWMHDPGLVSLDLVESSTISQAEKDLRHVLAFLSIHMPGGVLHAQGSGGSGSGLAVPTQTFLFQLKTLAHLVLFTVKFLKCLFFAGRNPASAAAAVGLPGVNLGIHNLAPTTKSDLANRLIVVINDLKVIYSQELQEGADATGMIKSLSVILSSLLPKSA